MRITATSCVSQYVAALLDIQKPGLFPFTVKFKESNIYRVVPHIVSKNGEEAFGFVSIPSMDKYRELIDDMIESHDMTYRPLFVSPLVATVSVYSPLAKKKVITPADVEGCSVARFQDAVLGDALDDFVREDSVKTVTNAAPHRVHAHRRRPPSASPPSSSRAPIPFPRRSARLPRRTSSTPSSGFSSVRGCSSRSGCAR